MSFRPQLLASTPTMEFTDLKIQSKSLSRTIEYPTRIPFQDYPETPKRLGTLSFCLVHIHTQQPESTLQLHRGNTLILRAKLQYSSTQLGAGEYPHTCMAPLTLDNSGKGESPAPLQEFGCRASAMYEGEPNYI